MQQLVRPTRCMKSVERRPICPVKPITFRFLISKRISRSQKVDIAGYLLVLRSFSFNATRNLTKSQTTSRPFRKHVVGENTKRHHDASRAQQAPNRQCTDSRTEKTLLMKR